MGAIAIQQRTSLHYEFSTLREAPGYVVAVSALLPVPDSSLLAPVGILALRGGRTSSKRWPSASAVRQRKRTSLVRARSTLRAAA